MNAAPPEIIISISGTSRALADERDQRREAVGVQLSETERPEPALRDAREDDAILVDLEAPRDVGHDVEHVLFRGTEVAAASAPAQRLDHDRGHLEAAGAEEAARRVAQVVAARAVQEHDERCRFAQALGDPHAVGLVAPRDIVHGGDAGAETLSWHLAQICL